MSVAEGQNGELRTHRGGSWRPPPALGAMTSGRTRAEAESGAHSIPHRWEFFKFSAMNCCSFKTETSAADGKAHTTRACGHLVRF